MRAHLLSWSGRGLPVMPLTGPVRLEVFTSAWRLWCPRLLARKDSDSSIYEIRSAAAEPVERKCPSFLRLHGRSAAFAWLPLYGKAAFSLSNQKAVGFGLTEPNRSPEGHPAEGPSKPQGGGTLSQTLRFCIKINCLCVSAACAKKFLRLRWAVHSQFLRYMYPLKPASQFLR